MELGRIGLWTPALDTQPRARANEIAAEIEEMGWAALWLPEAMTRDPLLNAAFFLGATQRLIVGTGVVPIYSHDALALAAAHNTLEEAFPGRFVLGLGVSHQTMVEGLRHTSYLPPIEAMRTYLDRVDAAPFLAVAPTTPRRRVLAALGPRMLTLAAERADGALPYLVTPDHTESARETLGPDKLLAVEQKVMLTTDAGVARETARKMLKIYTQLPNYVNNWKRLGFTDDDVDDMSDALVDAMVAWGDEATIRARVHEHLDAGADHVCIQVFPAEGMLPLEDWRRLAPALTT